MGQILSQMPLNTISDLLGALYVANLFLEVCVLVGCVAIMFACKVCMCGGLGCV